LTFIEGYITQDLDPAEVVFGIGIFCRFFALKDFLSYGPLKQVWADPPTAVRFRDNGEEADEPIRGLGYCQLVQLDKYNWLY
jgi:hypothetical protein